MAILIVRHGETTGNASGVVQMPDTPLNDRGLQQAERVAARVAGEGVAHILSSDYARAYLTAEKIRDASGATLAVEPLLRERHFGALRGRRHADIGDLYAADLAPPGGETWQAFHERIDRAWQAVTQTAATIEGNLAVVCHGLVCYSLALRQLTLPDGEQADLHIGNTALTIVEAVPPWRVKLLNSCSHADDVGVSTLAASGAA